MAHRSLDPADLVLSCNPERKPWHEIPDDGWLYDHLAEALNAAGSDQELANLFANDRWMRARCEQSGGSYAGYLHDLRVAWERAAARAAEPLALAQCARYALIRAAVRTICEGDVRIAPHRGRASEPALAGAYGSFLPEFAPRLVVSDREAAFNRAFSAAAASDLAEDERRSALGAALDAAAAIRDASAQAHALHQLGPHLTADHSARALGIALGIGSAYYRARAVGGLVPHLTGTALQRALDAGPRISSLPRAGFAVSAIWQIAVMPLVRAALRLRRRSPIHSLDEALSILYEDDRAGALIALAPSLHGEARETALNAARAIRDPRWRAETLAAFLPRAGDQRRALIGEVRCALSSCLLEYKSTTFDEMVLLCWDDAIFRLPIFNLRALLKLHRAIRDLAHRWEWA